MVSCLSDTNSSLSEDMLLPFNYAGPPNKGMSILFNPLNLDLIIWLALMNSVLSVMMWAEAGKLFMRLVLGSCVSTTDKRRMFLDWPITPRGGWETHGAELSVPVQKPVWRADLLPTPAFLSKPSQDLHWHKRNQCLFLYATWLLIKVT